MPERPRPTLAVAAVDQVTHVEDLPDTERMSDFELSHNLTGINNELYALLLAQIAQSDVSRQSEVFHSVYAGYPGRRIDQLSTYYDYLEQLEDFGLIERDGVERNITVGLTPYGRDHGLTVGGYMLDFSYRFDPSLRGLWEEALPIDRRVRTLMTPQGEIQTKVYPSLLRMKLIREFAGRMRDPELRRHPLHPDEIILPYNVQDLSRKHGVDAQRVRGDLIGLSKAGVVNYQSYEKGSAFTAYALANSEQLLADPSEISLNGSTPKKGFFFPRVVEYTLYRGHEDLTSEGGLHYMVDNYPEDVYGKNIDDVQDRVGKGLKILEGEGHLVPIGVEGTTKHGMLRVDAGHRMILSALAGTLIDAQSRDPRKIAEGQRLASRYVRDRIARTKLLDKARASFDAPAR